MPKLLRYLGISVLSASLCACGVQRARVDSAPAAQEGAVVLRENSGTWDTIVLRREKTRGRPVALVRQATTSRDRGRVHGGVVPAGTYRLVDLKTGNQRLALDYSKLSPFTVEAGQVTYLGTLLTAIAPRSRYVVGEPGTAVNREEGRALVEAEFPSLATIPVRAGWDAAASEPLRLLRYQLARATAGGANGMRDLGEEGVFFGTNGGLLLHVRDGKPLAPLDLRTGNAVYAIARTQDGTLLAGGANGLLKQSRDQGATWTDVANNLPFGHVEALEVAPDGTIYITHAHGLTTAVYSNTPGTLVWTRVTGDTRPAPTRLFANTITSLESRTLRNGDTLLVFLPPDKLARIDMRSGQADTRTLPGLAWDLRADTKGRVFCECYPIDSDLTHFSSADAGVTWQPVQMPAQKGTPLFRDDRFALFVDRNPLLGRAHVHESRDGGQTWMRREEAIRNVTVLGYSRDGRHLFGEHPLGALLISQDDGITWQPRP